MVRPSFVEVVPSLEVPNLWGLLSDSLLWMCPLHPSLRPCWVWDLVERPGWEMLGTSFLCLKLRVDLPATGVLDFG